MFVLARILTLAFLLCANTLHSQWIHFGVDGVLGLHYNTMDATSYQRPLYNGGFGMHLGISDPDHPERISFNGRLTFENDFQVYTILGNLKQDFAFRDLICSFQAHRQFNEKFSIYAGINIAVNLVNTVWLRPDDNIFSTQRQRSEALEAEVRQKVRKLNAGLEAGFMYPIGKHFSAGLHLNYYMMARLDEAISLDKSHPSGNVSLNFRPLALIAQCSYDLF